MRDVETADADRREWPLVLVSGAPAAGKTILATLVAHRVSTSEVGLLVLKGVGHDPNPATATLNRYAAAFFLAYVAGDEGMRAALVPVDGPTPLELETASL